MGACLFPCPGCARHIRTDERACPFCGAATPEGFGACAKPALTGPVLSRAAVLFMGATAVAACSGTVAAPGGGGDSGSSGDSPSSADSMPVALYGPGPVRDANVDSPGPVPAYGPGPIRDSGVADQGGDEDSGGPIALYGPAPVDSGSG